MFKRAMNTVIIIVLALLVSACETAGEVAERARDNPLAAQLITSQTTLRIIAAADNPSERAERVQEITATILERVDTGAVATIAELRQAAMDEVRWDELHPADADLIRLAIDRAAQRLREAVEAREDGLSEDDEIVVRTFIGWINSAAQRYR